MWIAGGRREAVFGMTKSRYFATTNCPFMPGW